MDTDLNSQLLNTIRVPMKLHYLTDMLPEPNYKPIESSADLKNAKKGKTMNLGNLSYRQQGAERSSKERSPPVDRSRKYDRYELLSVKAPKKNMKKAIRKKKEIFLDKK